MEEYKKFGMMKLSDGNYHTWRQRTELWLKREDLWDVINNPTPASPDNGWIKKDTIAKSTIGLLMEDRFLSDIKHETTARSTWWKLNRLHSQNNIGTRLVMYRKVFAARYEPGQNMSEHISDMLETASKLEDCGYKIIDEMMCSALLGSLPPDYAPLVTAIEGRDEKDITVDYIRQKILEEHRKREQGDISSTPTAAKALFTNPRGETYPTRRQLTCYYCKKVGHIRRDCRLLKNLEAHHEHTNRPDQKQDHSKLTMCRNLNTLEEQPRHTVLGTQQHTTTHRALSINSPKITGASRTWIIDTGASNHMCGDRTMLKNVTNLAHPVLVITASGERKQVEEQGDYDLRLEDNEGRAHTIKIKDILLVPSLTDNLISVTRLDDDQYTVRFNRGASWLERDGNIIRLGTLTNKLYSCDERPAPPDRTYFCRHTWHARLAHRNYEDLERMEREEMVEGMKIHECTAKGTCKPCNTAKMTNLPFAKEIQPRAQRPFQVLHTDVCGPISPESLGHNKYILSIIDEFTRYATTYIMKTKDQTTVMIQDYVEKGINKFGRRPDILFSDGGGEYENRPLNKYLSSHGTRHLKSLPYTPEENGLAERYNRTLMEATRSLLSQSKLANHLWAEIASTSTYLLNLVSHRAVHSSPYEMWHGNKPSVKHLKTIGTKCFFLNPHPDLKKLDPRGLQGVLIGYGTSTTHYRIWSPDDNKVYQSRKVVFEDEDCPIAKPDEEEKEESTVTLTSQPKENENDVSEDLPHPRRSTRDNLGIAPRMLTYDRPGISTHQRPDWYRSRTEAPKH